jgi:hypothetical protein
MTLPDYCKSRACPLSRGKIPWRSYVLAASRCAIRCVWKRQSTDNAPPRFSEEVCRLLPKGLRCCMLGKRRGNPNDKRFLQLAAPDGDLGWLIEIERELYSERRPRPKWDRVVTTDVSVYAGRTLMAEAEITKRPKLTRARMFRNGCRNQTNGQSDALSDCR